MAYEYDIFLSYNRKFPHGDWVNDMFYPLFSSYICDSLNKDVKIFKDNNNINPGEIWPESLKNALVKSKVMVSIFSPAYFRSEWCMKEFNVMYHRQIECKLNPKNGLIIPCKLFDGRHYPKVARNIQSLDCREYNLVGEGFKKSELYLKFQNDLQEWTEKLVTVFKNVPNWDKRFESKEWTDDVMEEIPISNFPNRLNAPKL